MGLDLMGSCFLLYNNDQTLLKSVVNVSAKNRGMSNFDMPADVNARAIEILPTDGCNDKERLNILAVSIRSRTFNPAIDQHYQLGTAGNFRLKP